MVQHEKGSKARRRWFVEDGPRKRHQRFLGEADLAEAFALFAIAAHRTGNEDDCHAATRFAIARGADMTAMEAAHES